MFRCTAPVAAFLSFAGLALAVGPERPSAPGAQTAKTFEAIAAKHGITAETPGVVVATRVKDRTQVFTLGRADLKEGTTLAGDTVFELASLSKPFTATAILMLHERGKLDINDPVRKYVPEIPETDAKHPLRIVHLLQHTGGLADYLEFEDVPRKNKEFATNEDFVPEFEKQKKMFPAKFSPGQKYEYSNSGYMLLGAIVARVSGRSYGEFLRENIFVPLKMDHSFVYERPNSRQKLAVKPPRSAAVGYSHNSRSKKAEWAESWGCPPRRNEEVLAVGDGNVWTCAADMLKWDRAVRDRALLKAETWAKALTPSRSRNGKTNYYGFGWVLRYDDGKLVGFGHDGDWGGFRTSYWVTVEPDRSAIVLSNRGNLDAGAFSDESTARR